MCSSGVTGNCEVPLPSSSPPTGYANRLRPRPACGPISQPAGAVSLNPSARTTPLLVSPRRSSMRRPPRFTATRTGFAYRCSSKAACKVGGYVRRFTFAEGGRRGLGSRHILSSPRRHARSQERVQPLRHARAAATLRACRDEGPPPKGARSSRVRHAAFILVLAFQLSWRTPRAGA